MASSNASSWYNSVVEFTEQSKNIKIPSTPRPLTRAEMDFILSMILDECLELTSTFPELQGRGKEHLTELLQARTERTDLIQEHSTASLVAEHADGFIDIIYYILNASAKAGINLDAFFNEVHSANMRKRDPETGKFILNEQGKVIKPPGYVGADTKALAARLLPQ